MAIICLVDNREKEYDNTLSVGGITHDEYHINWGNKRQSIGDKIKVSTIDCDYISPGIIGKKSVADINEQLKEYYWLENELKQKGLI